MIRSRILTPSEAYARAAALCDKCEQCSPDIIKKLTQWGVSSAEVSRILKKLIDSRYLDDNRFARAYAHDKLIFSGWGRYKIIQHLRAKRLERECVEQAFDGIEDSEYLSVAVKVVKAKARGLAGGLGIYENRLKTLRFAAQRGFEPSVITRIINRLVREQTETEAAD